MKKLLLLLLPFLLLAGCTPARESAAERWVDIAYQSRGTVSEACQMLRPQYNLRQRGLRVTDFLQNVSLRDACKEYVTSLQEYGSTGFSGSSVVAYAPARSVALVCIRDPFAERYVLAPLWIRSNGSDLEEVDIYPENLSSSWGSPEQTENALLRARAALPGPCQKIAI